MGLKIKTPKREGARGVRDPSGSEKKLESEISRTRGEGERAPGSLLLFLPRTPVLFDNYANAGMIVGQYVLGIKVPGRSNSVIFMISGDGRRRRAAKERARARESREPRVERGRGEGRKGSSILDDKSQALHLHRNMALWLRLLNARMRRRIAIAVVLYFSGSVICA